MRNLGAFGRLGDGCLELLYPERCAACGEDPRGAAWEERGPRVPGLRAWDRPHLCAECGRSLFARAPVLGQVRARHAEWPVAAAAPTTASLVRVVGAWKYHGLRGLGWPLARALATAGAGLQEAGWAPARGDLLVPVPLHCARRRARGFNQAAVLALLAARPLLATAVTDLLRRRRATGQQAMLTGAGARAANVAGAFAARGAGHGAPRRVFLVDDLVTSGATVAAAATALDAAGWRVAGILALGLGADQSGPGLSVDRPPGDF